MSPFSQILRDLRVKRNLRQKDAAELLGYEQSYLSSLEIGLKGPPKKAFIKQLISKLELNESEQQQLIDALNRSKRQYTLPLRASIEEYEIFSKLEPYLGNLNSQQIALMNVVLNIGDALHTETQQRSAVTEREESRM